MAKVKPGDRKKHGIKSGKAKGKYPLATQAQCRSAIKLRHHGKGVGAASVLARVARRARSQGWTAVLKAVTRARAADRNRKRKQ